MTSGLCDVLVQTGFANFLRNEHTTLPEVHDRLLSTNVTATWKYVCGRSLMPRLSAPLTSGCVRVCVSRNSFVKDGAVADPNGVRAKVRRHLTDKFFGPADTGVYSKYVAPTLPLHLRCRVANAPVWAAHMQRVVLCAHQICAGDPVQDGNRRA